MSDYKERPKMTRSELHRAEHQKTKTKKKHRGWKILLGIILLLVLGAVSYGAYAYFRTKNTANSIFDSQNSVQNNAADFDGKKPVSILLLGTDTGAFGRTEKLGNTDTMIIATINPKDKKVTLTSIPRDTMAEMIGDSSFNVQKINAAYSIGNAKMSMKTVSSLLNVPIKYYMAINMAGLEKMVNLVKGVDVDVPFDFSYDGNDFKKGPMHLNGKQALAYARMRYDDPENDYGRQKRQRQVIFSILKSAISLNTVANLEGILDSVSKNMKTNLEFDNMVNLAKNYSSSMKKTKSDYLHGRGAMIGEASYQVMTDKELQRVSDLVRREMNLESEPLDNNEIYQNKMNKKFDWSSPDSNQVYYIYSRDNPGELWDGTN